jgi:8-oxo-dGTP diphosphatase
MGDQAPVDLRCSAVVFRADSVLLCQRPTGEWVLPGGTPRHGEGSAACVLREVREETGLRVDPQRVAFVLEATNLDHGQHLIEIVFHASPIDNHADPRPVETGLDPHYVPVAQLPRLALRPPIAGYIRALHAAPHLRAGVYLGNVWRPDPNGVAGATPDVRRQQVD